MSKESYSNPGLDSSIANFADPGSDYLINTKNANINNNYHSNDASDVDDDDLSSVGSYQANNGFSNKNSMNPSIPSNTRTNPTGASSYDRPSDLSFLASANFSSDSLPDPTYTNMNQPFTPATPTLPTYNNNMSPVPPLNGTAGFNYRKYSNPSTNSPKISSTQRARPKSAVFMMDANNFAIAEDNDSVQSAIDNTPRSRMSANLPYRLGQLNNASLPPAVQSPYRSTSPVRSLSPSRSARSYRAKSPVRRSSSPSKTQSPFNFQPQEVMMHSNNSNSSLQVKPAHRKGHKYKHSSISMNLFQEPPPSISKNNKQLSIPDSFPIPTFKESLSSIKSGQKYRLLWSVFHLAISLAVFMIGYKFKLSSFSTLAHLVFYDSLGSLVIVFVDIMSNFEVWNNSSIAYPFGLGRLEVLVGFALSASLIMVGFDLVSHFLEEFIILIVVSEGADAHDGEQHSSHHIHGEHGSSTNWFVYEVVLMVTMAVTLISSNFVLAYDKINEIISALEDTSSSKVKGGILDTEITTSVDSFSKNLWLSIRRFSRIWTKNPTHLLTLIYSTFLVAIPLIPESIVSETSFDLNEMATLAVSLSLCYTGWKLVKTLGGILLCSYPYSDYDYHVLKSSIMDAIMSLDFFKQSHGVDKFYITKFNYDFFVVGLKITMKGADADEESRLRYEADRIIRQEIKHLSEDNSKIEITIDIDRY
ncbi:zinc-regulated protein [Scheffersomyces xylosifermentans]|uniref:zinc-regulated protein n=1 Tax=Scheffersomyces xylosifermentans TaxID=1304137 RepID=UPI00315D2B55